MRLVQLKHPEKGRRIAVAADATLTLVSREYPSCYHLFEEIIANGRNPESFIPTLLTEETLDYERIYNGSGAWRLLPSFDHPGDPARCILSGTGLTHKASAENRQRMHEHMSGENGLTDSMEMYLWGEEGGKPRAGTIGTQPEWFFKGNGTALKGPGDPLQVPSYGDDGGEEPEIAGVYVIDPNGRPWRIGFTVANEFSDHVMEKKNYLYLAPSKLRTPAIGPELILKHDFKDVMGRVSVFRGEQEIWSKQIKSGENNMSHSLENLEHHHFKYEQHRLPETVHIHFFGADAFSFGDNIALRDGDWMEVSFEGFGRPLRNPVRIINEKEELVTVHTFS